MAYDYIRLTVNTMEALPAERQVEVYDFAKFLKEKTKTALKKSTKKSSILNLIGIGKSGCSDIALNHDKYLYE
ncbi:MAG: DUF2281 domain-containing protein [Chitinivibrionales bacterium]|nr:DUF2281 domain-containing protein [Chitinivibrionales bacterium]